MSEWNFVLTEGDLRKILHTIEQRREANPDTPYCFQISVDAIPDGVGVEMSVKTSIEKLETSMIREMFEKGQL